MGEGNDFEFWRKIHIMFKMGWMGLVSEPGRVQCYFVLEKCEPHILFIGGWNFWKIEGGRSRFSCKNEVEKIHINISHGGHSCEEEYTLK